MCIDLMTVRMFLFHDPFLLTKEEEELPVCVACDTTNTAKHILIELLI